MTARLVLVEWDDACGAGRDWASTARAVAKPLRCRSVGWLIAESDTAVAILPHMHDADDDLGAVESGCGDMTIPKSAIRRMADLAETK